MGRQKCLKRIRRCQNCGAKTHQRFWKKEQCPICDSGIGYNLSTHGGIKVKEKQIKEKKKQRPTS